MEKEIVTLITIRKQTRGITQVSQNWKLKADKSVLEKRGQFLHLSNYINLILEENMTLLWITVFFGPFLRDTFISFRSNTVFKSQ